MKPVRAHQPSDKGPGPEKAQRAFTEHIFIKAFHT